jgi:hypothetical protein
MSAADYVGRKVDLFLFRNVAPLGDRLLTPALITETDGGLLVTGIEKMAQRFLMILGTPMGSMRYLPQVGCLFLAEARAGGWRTASDVSRSFAASLQDVKRQMRLVETASDPDDERLSDAKLLSATLENGVALLRIQLTSLSGTATFIAPLPVTLY